MNVALWLEVPKAPDLQKLTEVLDDKFGNFFDDHFLLMVFQAIPLLDVGLRKMPKILLDDINDPVCKIGLEVVTIPPVRCFLRLVQRAVSGLEHRN
jgi:hypothetical protein